MITIDGYTIQSHAEDPTLRDKSYQDFLASWPRFMQRTRVPMKLRELVVQLAPEFQFFLQDDIGNIVGICRSIPMYWPGTAELLPVGYDEARARAIRDLQDGKSMNTLLALSITIPARFRSKGLSSIAIRAMKEICKVHHLKYIIVPVRPSLKVNYPLTPIADYVKWTTDDGFPFDPWLRTHIRLGAKVLGCSPKSMTYEGTIKEWESWTELRFPQSGEYIIAGGGSPLKIDRESNNGTYYDPNVWVAYSLGTI